jgi:hypothetical protein
MVPLTVAEAAHRLGISEAGVRKRAQRGQIPHERDDVGRLFVWVSPGETRHAESRDRDTLSRDELVEELRAHNTTLREQLQFERQAHAEAKRIIAGLVERIPPQLEPPAEGRESPETATPQPGRVAPQPAVESTQAQESPEMHMPSAGGGPRPREQQTASERPWWRRMFGG